MACAPRPNSKATKIAYRILGVPSNMRSVVRKPYERKDKRDLPFGPPMVGVGGPNHGGY